MTPMCMEVQELYRIAGTDKQKRVQGVEQGRTDLQV